MDVEIQTSKTTNTLVKWTVAIPRANSGVKTKSFLVYGYSCYLNLYIRTNDEWLLTLETSSDRYPPHSPCIYLTVLFRDKGRDFYLSDVFISGKNSELWKTSYYTFKINYPDIQVVGTCLEFRFLFYRGIPDPESSIKEEKSVQTSDPNPDNRLGLENLSLDFSKLVEDGTDTDVQLKCGDVSIGAHKLILGARSEVFRTMMQSDMVEGREGIVEIVDMEPKILKIFIRYIYTGNLPELTMDTALPIYEVADKYQVEALKKTSNQFLVKNLSPENALGILMMADAHSDSDLKGQLVSYIIEEKIPSRKVEWLKFCNEYPKLANEVLNYFYDLPSVSQ